MGFEMVAVVYLFLYHWVNFLIHYMAHLIYTWGCNSCVGQIRCFIWMCLNDTVNLCVFHFPFCFANFLNWQLLSDWMRFEVSRHSSFILEMLSSFRLSHGLLLLLSQEFRLSSDLMTLFSSFTSPLKSQFHF